MNKIKTKIFNYISNLVDNHNANSDLKVNISWWKHYLLLTYKCNKTYESLTLSLNTCMEIKKWKEYYKEQFDNYIKLIEEKKESKHE